MTQRRYQRRRPKLPRAVLYVLICLLAVVCFGLIAYKAPPTPEAVDYWGEVDDSPEVEEPAGVHSKSPISTYKDCEIAHLGMFPWAKFGVWNDERRDSTKDAFILMGVPEVTAIKAVYAMEHLPSDDVLAVGNAGGIGRSGETYSPVFDTTYKSQANGRVMCRNSKLIFSNPAAATAAPIWKVDGYVLGDFMACSNATRFTPGVLIPVPPSSPSLVPMPPSESGITVVPPTAPHMPYLGRVNHVPEPGTFWLMLLGFIGLVWSRRVRKVSQQNPVYSSRMG